MAFKPRESDGLNLRAAVRYLNSAVSPAFECNKPDNLTRALFELKPEGVTASYNPRISNGANLKILVSALPRATTPSNEASTAENTVKAMYGLLPDNVVANYYIRESAASNLSRLIPVLELQIIKSNDSNINNLIARAVWGLIDLLKTEPVQTLIYESDFSTGTDGWIGLDCTLAANTDGIGGEDDTLRATVTDDRGFLGRLIKSNILEVGKTYSASLEYYAAAPNGFENISILGNSTWGTDLSIVNDSWETFAASGVAASTIFAIHIRADSLNQQIHLKRIRIYEVS